jgi:hypothetical protein
MIQQQSRSKNQYTTPSVAGSSSSLKNYTASSNLKVLVITRDSILKRYLKVPLNQIVLNNLESSVHADYFYSQIVLFADDHHTKIMKCPLQWLKGKQIDTDKIKQFIDDVKAVYES